MNIRMEEVNKLNKYLIWEFFNWSEVNILTVARIKKGFKSSIGCNLNKYKFNKKNLISKKILFNVKKKLKFPAVIKPINEGSSVDVYICSEKNFLRNLKKLSIYREILIEEFIGGREIQVAILGKKKLGAIELIPRRKFYDYEAKYN